MRALVVIFLGVLSAGVLAAQPNTRPVPVEQAAQAMTAPPGFKVTLFAGEPELVQPIAFCFDHRGRIWVAENFSYPNGKLEGNDRISIYEDTDGDGRFDKKKTFYDKFGYLTGLLVDGKGVWAASAPNVVYIPDADQDDVPDGPPVKHLEGWTWDGKHNVVNNLHFGPDGWLYGLHGITLPSSVKMSGQDDSQKIKIGPGVWRYHPQLKRFEFITEGTTNPWGIDWNDYGDAFITGSVTPHLFQVIHGAHYQRMHGNDFNPHIYAQMKTCADHLHWAGGDWTSSRDAKGAHGTAGGGHSHCGGVIYLGEAFPEGYRGSIFTANIHGNRLNNDYFKRKGSGWVATHGPDFLFANDKWFRGVTELVGPDGAIYFSDWSDTGECHHYTNQQVGTGRLYRVAYEGSGVGVQGSAKQDLRKLADEQLVALQLSKNEFYVRQARRMLVERGPKAEVHAALRKIINGDAPITGKLRALWTLYSTQGTDEAQLLKLSQHEDEYMRSWGVRLLGDVAEAKSPEVITRFESMARSDASPMVRLWLASALQRLPLEQRWGIAEALLSHGEDAEDQYLPYMYWYGIEPLVPADKARALKLMSATKLKKVRELIARRVAAMAK